jgi:NSS family neurotransmitter:Na+ symporter
MVSEFMVGRTSRANTAGAYHKLAPGTQWKWVGRLGVLTGFVIMGFYMVVCGWTLVYIFQSVSGYLFGVDNLSANFIELQSNPAKQIIWMIIFTLLTAFFILPREERD